MRTPASIAGRAEGVALVANDVGGVGGMERQLGRLVSGLLQAGVPVTVIARTCALDPHEDLCFVRVPGPRRPFTVAYPAFFLLASLFAARRGNALLHTTGAIVANRTDISSIHYCHRGAADTLAGPRASRTSLLYRINASVAARLSRAGELWCYRPGRTRVLCAVSEGLAAELRTHFPNMASRIRVVPNGVDTSEFHPDATARTHIRKKLGIEEHIPIALFAGGDWRRKGLRYVVDALVHAPSWHLVVVGAGDGNELLTRAQQAGTKSRLHFLGSVEHMAPVYAAADAFVLPSSYETFSLVTYEAAASGLPVLATPVSGIEDLVRPGRNGWFISRDAQDIAHHLNELASDHALARGMAEEARRTATAFSWDVMVEGYIATYEEFGLPQS